jgi:hypothetical protein
MDTHLMVIGGLCLGGSLLVVVPPLLEFGWRELNKKDEEL